MSSGFDVELHIPLFSWRLQKVFFFTGIYSTNRASNWLWLQNQENPQNGQNVCDFQVRTPICHIVTVRKIRAPIKIKSPPPKMRNFMDMAFPAERTHFFRASIKLTQPFPAPELRTEILRTRGFFWNCFTRLREKGPGGCLPQWSTKGPFSMKMPSQRDLRDTLMSRGKNWLPTVSRLFLTRNYPRPDSLPKCLQNCLLPTREGISFSFNINPAVRVTARQLRDKNCLEAIFVSRHQGVFSGPLGWNPPEKSTKMKKFALDQVVGNMLLVLAVCIRK